MNHETKIIELMKQARTSIVVPSREDVHSLLELVTKKHDIRYTMGESKNVARAAYAFRRIVSGYKTLFITGCSVAVAVLLVVLPTYSSDQVSLSRDVIILEQEQELQTLDQEDIIIETIVANYLNELANY